MCGYRIYTNLDKSIRNSFCSKSHPIEKASILMWVYKVPIRCKKALLNRRLRSVVDMAFNSASSESGAPSCAEVVRCSLRPPSGRIQISFRNLVPLIKCIRSRSLKTDVSFCEFFSSFFQKNFQLLFNSFSFFFLFYCGHILDFFQFFYFKINSEFSFLHMGTSLSDVRY